MAKGRLISTNFWMDGKVEDDFTPEDKYGYLWCLTNPHTNLCGCYEVSIKQIAHELGYNTDTVERLLKRLDGAHNVIRYSAPTKELLVLNWYRYNWNASEKLDKPLLAEIRAVKCDSFREYLADRYNERDSVSAPYEYWTDQQPQPPEEPPKPQRPRGAGAGAPPEKKVRHKRGQYGWVRLTDEEMDRLSQDLGPEELARCITYIDESAQATGNKNKWKDWNLVIRKCSKGRWGLERATAAPGQRPSASQGAAQDLRELHELFGEG